jgi:hypothetical protein
MAAELQREPGPKRAIGSLHCARAGQQARDVVTSEYAMLPTAKALTESLAILRQQRGAGAQAHEQILELGPDRLDVAECNAGRDQSHELAIVLLLEAMREPDGVDLAASGDIAARANRIERTLYGHLTAAQTRAH